VDAASVEDTEAFGERVGAVAAPGTVLALRGGLGAGKTAFARGLARGLGVSGPVTSPTYTLVNEYEGRMPFYHMDAYRLGSEADFELLDAARYLYGDGLCAIEWSERVAGALPPDAVVVEIVPRDNGSRTILLTGAVIEEALG